MRSRSTARIGSASTPARPIEAATRFHPLFLYESISGLLGAAFLVFLGHRLRSWLRPGDLLLVFFIWYGTTRFVLESLRADNWTFFGVPTAQIVSMAFIAIGVVGLILRHRRSRMGDRRPRTRRLRRGARSGGVDDTADRRAVGQRRRDGLCERAGSTAGAQDAEDESGIDHDATDADEPRTDADEPVTHADEPGPRPSP